MTKQYHGSFRLAGAAYGFRFLGQGGWTSLASRLKGRLTGSPPGNEVSVVRPELQRQPAIIQQAKNTGIVVGPKPIVIDIVESQYWLTGSLDCGCFQRISPRQKNPLTGYDHSRI